jgi:hypothetical protein
MLRSESGYFSDFNSYELPAVERPQLTGAPGLDF